MHGLKWNYIHCTGCSMKNEKEPKSVGKLRTKMFEQVKKGDSAWWIKYVEKNINLIKIEYTKIADLSSCYKHYKENKQLEQNDLSSKEAFDQGWDYPGPDGIYKDAPNFGFGMLLPRTCGNCSIADSFYWKVVNGGEGKKDTETDQAFKEMLERVKNEPWSLVVSEDE